MLSRDWWVQTIGQPAVQVVIREKVVCDPREGLLADIRWGYLRASRSIGTLTEQVAPSIMTCGDMAKDIAIKPWPVADGGRGGKRLSRE